MHCNIEHVPTPDPYLRGLTKRCSANMQNLNFANFSPVQLLMFVIHQAFLCTRQQFCCHHPTPLSSPLWARLTISHPHEKETEKTEKVAGTLPQTDEFGVCSAPKFPITCK